MIPQNNTILIHRIAGQLPENIVLVSSRKVTEGSSVPLNKSVLTDSSSKSLSSTEVLDEDAAITAVIDAAELKLEDHQSKKGQAGGRFMSRSCYGHGPLEGETPPPGYVCRSCRIPGHFIQHCTLEIKKPPPGYICYRCRIPGHFIQYCPTIGDPNFDKNKMTRSLAPVVTPSPVDGILESLVSSASASAVDDLPAELHCQLCKKVMADAVLTSKCCFDSFCDKCIRDYIITQSKCICGAMVLADSLIPNHTVRSTISNMLSTRAGGSTTNGMTKHRSSSGSNPVPKLQSQVPPAASEREEIKPPMDHHVSEAAAPDGGLQVATKDDLVNQALEKLAANVDPQSKDEVSSAELPVEKAGTSANLKLQDGGESILKITTVSGTLEQNATKTDQPKKRKKAGSTKIVQPNNADFGYDIPIDPTYYNPFVGGYPWVTEPYMYGSMGMPYGCYPMGPYGISPMNIMPPQAPPTHGYPPNYHRHEAHPTPQRGTEAAAYSRLSEWHKDTGIQSRSSDGNRQGGGSHRSESRKRTRSSPERRDHRRSDRVPDDCYEDHSKKRMHVSSPMDGEKPSSRRSRHSSRSVTREDSSDDERNFKRR